ncbi:MAG TPA: SIMPL domain-containing protein [Pseudonocardiaceae bacterium]|nr:SIMPL domain-containing protein [Pseudonocardiaceae bacterium]
MAELVTTGNGEVERIADQAGLTLRYTNRGKDRTTAVDALTRRIAAVEPLLERDGVTVRSRRLAVHDVWERRRRTGAEASQAYVLLVTDVTVLNDVVGELVTTEPSELHGPNWELADPSDARREAQREAVADARTTALGYADALGSRLGKLVRVDDSSPGYVPLRYSARAMAASPGGAPDIAELSLEPQPVTVSAMCSITWELLV